MGKVTWFCLANWSITFSAIQLSLNWSLFPIPLKQEVIIERIALFDESGNPRIKEVTADDKEHSQWYDRNTMWLYSRT